MTPLVLALAALSGAGIVLALRFIYHLWKFTVCPCAASKWEQEHGDREPRPPDHQR